MILLLQNCFRLAYTKAVAVFCPNYEQTYIQ